MASEAGGGSTDAAGGGRPRRLHWSSIVFRAVTLMRGLLLPALGVLIAARGERWQLIFGLFFLPALGFEIVRFLTRRYRFAAEDLVVTEGLLFRNERHIPYRRVQGVDATQNPIQRLLGVAEVRLQTAGGQEAEAELKVVDLAAVEELRARIFGERAVPRADAPAEAAQGERILALPPDELVRLGLVVNRGLALVAILLGASWELDLWDRPGVLGRLRAWLGGLFEQPGMVLISVGAAAFLTLWVLSVVWALLRFHGFTLHLCGEDLRLSCGLLTRHAATVPRHRVQLLSIQARPLHRLFRRVTIRIETAGGGAGGEGEREDAISRRWFVPILPVERVEGLVAAALPAFSLREALWRPLAPRAARRRGRLGALWGLALGGAALATMRTPAGVVALIALPALLGAWAWLASRRTQWTLTPRCFAVRRGVLGRATTVTLLERVQVVRLERSPFDRRWGMASLAVDTAGAGAAGQRVALRDLPAELAERLRAHLAERAAATELAW